MATNFEFYKTIIQETIEKWGTFCELIASLGLPQLCNKDECEKCKENLAEFLYAEHIEPPKLTKRERAFCEFVQSGCIARDKSGELNWYKESTVNNKDVDMWGRGMSNNLFSKIHGDWCEFDFIKWEDEKPWAVEDLLKLEVEEDEQNL